MAAPWTCPNGHCWGSTDNVPTLCPVCGAAPDPGESLPTDPTRRGDDDSSHTGKRRVESSDSWATGVPPGAHTPPFPGAGAPAGPGPRPAGLPGYAVLSELGRGGMGVVYQARQLALNRVVALKMVLAGGHASRGDLERFRQEAEAVARLQHPHIVQVFEVGEHHGLPFFSLEYCPGGSLDKQLDGTPRPPAAAAALVERLARAMQAAHDKGVIHRDLKPANILLAADGTPKVSDFGLVKFLDARAEPTRTGAVLGTPSYMAPEQADGKTRQVGPATDVYSLGAILYELLTGRPPFKGASALDTLDQVRGQEPVSPRRLQAKLPRDLETVCLKCLKKEPQKRYGSALELAEDLRRFQAGEPVAARPAGALERGWRWCRRNPAVAATSAAFLLLLVGSLAGLTVLYLDAERQRGVAEREGAKAAEQRDLADALAARAKQLQRDAEVQARLAHEQANRSRQVTAVLTGMFQASDPLGLNGFAFGLADRTGEKLTTRELLQRVAERVAASKDLLPQVKADLLDTVGNVYRSQGRHREAEPLLRQALEMRQQAKAPPGEMASSLHSLAWLHHERGNYPEALKLYRKALGLRLAEPERDEVAVTNSYLNLAWVLTEMQQFAEAEKLYREAIRGRVKHFGPDNREAALAKGALAGLYLDSGRYLEALPLVLEMKQTLSKLEGDKTIWEGANLFQHGVLQHLLWKDHAGAEKTLRESLRVVREALGPDHLYVAIPLAQLAIVQKTLGKFDEAEKNFREALEIVGARVGQGHPKVLILVREIAELLRRRDRGAEGDALFEELLKGHRERFGPAHPFVADVLGAYARHLGLCQRTAREEELLRQAVKIYRSAPELPRPGFVVCLMDLARTLVNQQKDPDQVPGLLAEAERLVPAARAAERATLRHGLALLRCDVLLQAGKHAEAAAALREYRKGMPAKANPLTDVAFRYAGCVAAAEKAGGLATDERERLAGEYAAEAVGMLRQAWQSGAAGAASWETRVPLRPLRGRPEFRALMDDIRAGKKAPAGDGD